MDRDFLIELFSAFGPVSLRRMFSGYGVSVDGTTFALVLRGMVHFRVDDQTVSRFEAERVKPFQYETRGKTITVGSYWQLPARLYDDPEELAEWARAALGAAERALASKRLRGKPRKKAVTKKVGKKSAAKAAATTKRAGRRTAKR
ncbi:MAG: TfoX/Sxy family protein [Xanthobacteraceae bacterium]